MGKGTGKQDSFGEQTNDALFLFVLFCIIFMMLVIGNEDGQKDLLII